MHTGQLASIQAAGAAARLRRLIRGVFGPGHAGELQDQCFWHRDSLWLLPKGRSLERPPSALGSSHRCRTDHFPAGAIGSSAGSNPARSSPARARSVPPSRAIRS